MEKTQIYEVRYPCKNAAEVPKVETLMRGAGFTRITVAGERSIIGLLRSEGLNEAYDLVKTVVNESQGSILGLDMKNVTEEYNSISMRIKRALKLAKTA